MLRVYEKRWAKAQAAMNKDQVVGLVEIKDYFVNVERLLVSRQAKTWDDI
jgi:hypothetical protein